MSHNLFTLKGVVQHYAWGGFEYIPRLLHLQNTDHKPFAEYWLGAHPNHPAKTNNTDLSQLLQTHPQFLGTDVLQKFSSLPFLLKVLDVRQMLSIQVHPDKTSAAKEFAIENEKGIPVTAPHRNYKDENHKPELMVALSDFWLLHGFKKKNDLQRILSSIPEFSTLVKIFAEQDYKGLYTHVMNMPQEHVNAMLQPVLDRIVPLYKNNELQKTDESFWAARAALHFCKNELIDRGIFSIYFFNLLHLKKGEGIFQPEGMPHAYLEGQNIEVMANSDNVLRAGLTDKHIDVAELMKYVKFEATEPNVLRPANTDHKVFESPAEEFELHQYSHGEQPEVVKTSSAEIWFLLSGKLAIESENEKLELTGGESVFVAAGTMANLKMNEKGELFRVLVPNVRKN